MTKNELESLKLEGFMQQQDKEYFSLRILTDAGNLSSNEMVCLAEISELYGNGYMGFTTRQCVEIPWIREDLIPEVKKRILNAGIKTGGTGTRVVAVAACKGALCRFGLLDSQEIAKNLDRKFLGIDLPGKFKIGVAACPNNCVKAPISDLGFLAQNEPKVEADMCKGCKICERTCKVDAISMVHKKAVIDYDKCISCGQCIKACPFKSMKLDNEGVAVYLGGKFGRNLRIGNRLKKLYQPDELEAVTEMVIDYYKNNASKGERLGMTISRLGFNHIKNALDI
ncbi:4Fe-4S binding protein [Clostridium sp. YIM B02569]|uniref:4Fe-4S binding protein n=1 Tax=Clostridium sp. YIM B02569 TaxID=2911967 RepID=UPI001EEE12A9|nr:4Fe-4S binding protein [Clostridium sp. YIM B02569]